MTPDTIIPKKSSIVQRKIASMLAKNGVRTKFFSGDPSLEGFAIKLDGQAYVTVNTSLPDEQQLHVARRELALLDQLSDGQSSLFLPDSAKLQAEARKELRCV
jgi:hypothetical protein